MKGLRLRVGGYRVGAKRRLSRRVRVAGRETGERNHRVWMAGRAEAEALCRALNRVAPAPFVCEGHSGSSFSLSLAYRVVASYGEYISLERFFKVGAGGSVLQYRYPCGCARWFRSVFSSWEELVWMLEVELDGMIL